MNSVGADRLAKDILAAGKDLQDRGLIVATEGNLSARLPGGRFLITPAGRAKGELEPADLVVIDGRGQAQGSAAERPSTEWPLHLAAYEEVPEAMAVVHAHPPHATAFALAGRALDGAWLAETITTLGAIPLAPYGAPSTLELPAALRPFFQAGHRAILMRSHGAICLGGSVREALHRMQQVEQLARIVWLAESLGGAGRLSADQLLKLREIQGNYVSDRGVDRELPPCVPGEGI